MTARQPAVTVVVATYRRRRVLPRTLACILGQENVAARVVVVDDASGDDTWSYLQSVASDRCTVLQTSGEEGVGFARNAGLAMVDTPYVAFCDDDDLWAPGKLAAQLDALAADGQARWSCTGAITIDASENILGHHRLDAGGDVLDALLGVDVIPGGASSVLADVDLVREVGGWDEGIESQHDWDLWIRLAQRSPVTSVDRPLVGYRVWAGAMSWDIGPMDRAYQAIAERYRSTGDVRPEADRMFDQYIARMELRHRDRVGAARRHLRVARQHRLPRQVVHAAGAFLAPGPTERWRARRELQQIPATWRTEAERWLSSLPAPIEPAVA